MEVPARIHVLFARNVPKAIVIRRGPSGQTAIIGWDRTDNSFTVGQWLKGKIYHYRSDISPDGCYWIYFAMGAYSHTWTAVAKAPYLKALDFYPKRDAWNGGGLFETNIKYWLNEGGPTEHQYERHTSGLSIVNQWKKQPNMQCECPGIYFFRLERDGWTRGDTVESGKYRTGDLKHTTKFLKQINNDWCLCKLFNS